MKKILALGISLVLAISIFSGCGNGTPATSSSPNTALSPSTSTDAPKKDVTLNLAIWDEKQQAVTEELIAAFKKTNSNIEIELTVMPPDQYWTVIQAGLTSGSGPDLFWMSGDRAISIMPANLLLPLKSYIERDGVDMGKFPASIKQFYQHDNDYYGIPKDFDTIGIFYNKALFDAAGVEYPKQGWTWDDLLEKSKKLTTISPDGGQNNYGIVMSQNIQSSVFNFLYQNGGSVYSADGKTVTIDSPENLETLQFMTDIMFKYKVSPDGVEQTELGAAAMFTSGLAAMIPDGSWMANYYCDILGDDVDVAWMPAKKKSTCILNGIAYSASANTKNPDAAWEFLKFLATKEAAEIQSKVVVPAYEGAGAAFVNKIPSMNLQVLLDQAETAVPYPFAYQNVDAVESALNAELQDVWIGQKDVATALKNAQANMEKELAN